MIKTAILVSGNGTNLQAIIDAHAAGIIRNCELSAVISSNPKAFALKRALAADIPEFVIDPQDYTNNANQYFSALLSKLYAFDTDLIVCAGFNYILAPSITNSFPDRIINIHPSLIPAFCGPGMYGLRVHKAVLDYGAKITGATVHFVTNEVDAGPIILQKAVSVHSKDTPETLQKRVMKETEWKILPKAISLFCEGRIQVKGRSVLIR